MDTTNGSVMRKVYIQNATNIDWEDIAADKYYIYIGDFGNNQGSRTNLRIYKVLIQDFLNQDTLLADTIQFNYADQTDFTPTTFSTNYDAEALIALGDSLYIFTKNWGNLKTNIYPVNKNPGQYSLNKIDSINTQGWITGADYDSTTNQILLIGYTFNTAFYIRINAWQNLFSTGTMVRGTLQPNSSIQIEGVARMDSNRYWISSETLQSTVSQLHIFDYRFPLSLPVLRQNPAIPVYPNPSNHFIHIPSKKETQVTIYTSLGKPILQSSDKQIDISSFIKGHYIIQLKQGPNTYYQKLTIL